LRCEYEELRGFHYKVFIKAIEPVNTRNLKELEALKKRVGSKDVAFIERLGAIIEVVKHNSTFDAEEPTRARTTRNAPFPEYKDSLWQIKNARDRAFRAAAERTFKDAVLRYFEWIACKSYPEPERIHKRIFMTAKNFF
jgi:hypothetical protein